MKHIVRLGDVATYINGYAFKPSDWSTDGVPIIRIQNLTGNSSQVNYFNGKYDSKFEVHTGDVLISWSASLGVYIWHDTKAVLNQHIFKVCFDKVDIDKDFFVYQVENILHKATSQAHGATMRHLTRPIFNSLPFYLPSKDEQARIARELTLVSSIISKKEKELHKLDELVESRFIELFGDPIKNQLGWPVKKMKEISIKIVNGNTPHGGSQVYTKNGIMFIRSQNVWKNELILDDIVYLDNDTNQKMNDSILHKGDILITKTGRINTENSSLGRSAIYEGEDGKANINGHVYLVRLVNGIDRRFVLQILISDAYKDLIRRTCVGGIDKRQLNRNHIEDFPIIQPPYELQKIFSEFTQQADKSKYRGEKSWHLLYAFYKKAMNMI